MTTETDTVWESTLDKIFKCKVTRSGDYKGVLTVVNTENQFVLLEKEVTLSYRAMFGPDVDDIGYWEELCIQAVDSQ